MKHTLDDLPSLSIFYLKKRRLLQPGTAVELAWFKCDKLLMRTRLIIDDDGVEMVGGKIYFDRTDCHFGGQRFWFLCPDCTKRVGVLYGADFVCRDCLNLNYRCQYENDLQRAIRKSHNFKQRHFGSVLPTLKPKYQHNQTHLSNLGKYIQLRVNINSSLKKQLFVLNIINKYRFICH